MREWDAPLSFPFTSPRHSFLVGVGVARQMGKAVFPVTLATAPQAKWSRADRRLWTASPAMSGRSSGSGFGVPLIPTPRTLGVSVLVGGCRSHVPCVALSLFPGGVRVWFQPACRGGDGARFHGPQAPRTRGGFLLILSPGLGRGVSR